MCVRMSEWMGSVWCISCSFIVAHDSTHTKIINCNYFWHKYVMTCVCVCVSSPASRVPCVVIVWSLVSHLRTRSLDVVVVPTRFYFYAVFVRALLCSFIVVQLIKYYVSWLPAKRIRSFGRSTLDKRNKKCSSFFFILLLLFGTAVFCSCFRYSFRYDFPI